MKRRWETPKIGQMRTLKAALRKIRDWMPDHRYLAPAWFDEARYLIQRPEFERLTKETPLHGRVLNAGCGEGLYSGFLESFERVTEIVNLDLHRPTITTTRRDQRHRDESGSLTALPFQTGSFDACLCSEVLEHIPEDAKALAELARCIKRDGLLLVSVPTPPAPFDEHHVREGYTFADLDALLQSHGFVVEGYTYCLYALCRALYVAWQAQHSIARRNFFPRIALRALAHLDRRLKVGTPWDLVVLARRGPHAANVQTPA